MDQVTTGETNVPLNSLSTITNETEEDNPQELQPSQSSEPLLNEIEGKESVIRKHCEDAIRRGDKQCIWLCIPHNKTWVARDIPLSSNGKPLAIYDLRKQLTWWKRIALKSVVGLVETDIQFINVNSKGQVEVIATPFDRQAREKGYEEEIEEMRKLVEGLTPCGPNVKGESHDPAEYCECTTEDEFLGPYAAYCPYSKILESEERKQLLMTIPLMLDFHWHCRSSRDSVEFLRKSAFVSKYSDLTEDTYYDAACPYGKQIKALMVIEGWRIDRITYSVGISLACSICVVAIVTAATHSVDAGWSAGSYTLAFATLVVATMTLLSAIT